MKRRILASLMAVMLLLGLLPTSAFAAGSEELAPGEVRATKRLLSQEPDEDGCYTLELTVQGGEGTQVETGTNVDVVLVVDNSGSMGSSVGYQCNTPKESFTEHAHVLWRSYTCPNCGATYNSSLLGLLWDTRPSYCTGQKGSAKRIETAKEVSATFAEKVLSTGSGNRMAVIGFSHGDRFGGANDTDAIKVSQGLTSELSKVTSKINDMKADGGTNYSAALQQAQDWLNDRSDKSRPAYVVFISDGAPGLSGESIGNTNWDGSVQAQALKNAGITIYTVGIALEGRDGEYLQSLATSPGHYQNVTGLDYADQLAEILDTWAAVITTVPAGRSAVMTDVVNTEKFDVVEVDQKLTNENSDGKSYVWNIGDITEMKQAVTIKIKPKDGVYGDGIFTNEDVHLTYTDTEGAEQTVGKDEIGNPSVSIAAYRVQYEWTGAPTDTVYNEAGEIVTLVLPTDSNKYVSGQPYTVDATYAKDFAVFTHDTYGNVNGAYTFSGWNDPNSGTMGNEDVTISGSWVMGEVTVPTHTVTYELAGGTAPDGVDYDTETVTHGASVTVKAAPVRDGFAFLGWSNGSGTNQPNDTLTVTSNITLTAQWTPKTTPLDPVVAAYRVEHYQQQLDGTYALFEAEFPLYAAVETTVNAVARTYEHYHLNASADGTLMSGSVTRPVQGPDGRPQILTLKLFYDLDTYTVSYDLNGGTAPDGVDYDAETVIRGASVTVKAAPVRDGFAFLGWSNGSGTNQPDDLLTVTSNITLTAQWTPKTTPLDPVVAAYRVEHYQQQLDGTYALFEAEFPLYAAVETTVNAVARTYEHYHLNASADGTLMSGSVTRPVQGPDGRPQILTLKLFYDLDTYTVSYNWGNVYPTSAVLPIDENTYPTNTPYQVDTAYTAGMTVAEDGLTYTFSGWNDPNSGVMGDHDVTITGFWTKSGPEEPEIPGPDDETVKQLLDGRVAVACVTSGEHAQQPYDLIDNTYVVNQTGSTAEVVITGSQYVTAYNQLLGGDHTLMGNSTQSAVLTYDGAYWTTDSMVTFQVRCETQEPTGEYTVTFDSQGGSFVSSQTVAEGGTAYEPAAPTLDGYSFDGWYLSGVEYAFGTPVFSDITLVARWTENILPPPPVDPDPPYVPPYVPVTPTPTPGEDEVDIVDEDVPLSSAVGLNLEDHFAYIAGYPDGTVQPKGNITRAEVATIFFRLLTDDTRAIYWSQENDYSDVAADSWYNNAVSTLSSMGVVSGYPDGAFRPNAPITRAEFVKIAVSFFAEMDAPYDGSFTDVKDGQWFTGYVAGAVEHDLVGGYPDGTFRPTANISRAEACAIVNRVLERKPHADHLLPESEMNTWPDNADKAIWYYADMQEATNSHDYDMPTEDEQAAEAVEQWTEKLPERDWHALELEWADANAAPGGQAAG